MKPLIKIAIILFVLFAKLSYGQATSTITYDAGTTINLSTGADVCATSIIINGTYSGSGTICSGALPVTMSSFTASVNNNNSTLIWVTEVELNNSGFDIERTTVTLSGAGGWKKIAFITGNGTTTQPKGYLYEDKKLTKGTYRYRLKQTDYNGNFEYFELAGDVIIAPPNKFTVSQNYPNPSNPNTTILFNIPLLRGVSEGWGVFTSLIIYDIIGNELKVLLNQQLQPGSYSINFDASGLASGMYFYKLVSGDFTQTKKMLLIK